MIKINKVTEHFGTAYKAAKAIGVTHQQYHFWQKQGFIPAGRGRQIERLTSGAVTANEVYIEAGELQVDKFV